MGSGLWVNPSHFPMTPPAVGEGCGQRRAPGETSEGSPLRMWPLGWQHGHNLGAG